MALVATYGDTNAYNIKIYDLSGGGYYAQLEDVNTPVFKRRGSATEDLVTKISGANAASYIDRYTSYNYDAPSKTLTLSGAIDTNTGVTFTRTLTFVFISAYLVKDTLAITTNAAGGEIHITNWNFYQTINAIWDIDNSNYGDNTSQTALGLGVQLTNGGPIYGCIPEVNYLNKGYNYKRALASVSGIACVWVPAIFTYYVALTANVPITFTQYFFKSTNTFYDFMLQAQLALATAYGFTGTTFDKIVKVTALINITTRDDRTTIQLLPSYNYLQTFSRDSFWQSFAISDAYEQLGIQVWEAAQLGSGQMPTYIAGDNTTSTTHKDEGTLLHMIRAWYDKKKRGLTVNMSVLQLCVTWVATFVTNNQYRFTSVNPTIFEMWNDNFIFTPSTTYCGYSQGLYIVFLKCALDFGLTGVTQSMIDNALIQYLALYKNGYVNYSSNKAIIGPDVLVGEALHILLFGTSMLPDSIVNDTCQKINDVSMAPGGAKIVCNSDGTYLDPSNFHDASAKGDYQNGGSWFLYEYLAWWCGVYHKHESSGLRLGQKKAIEIYKEPVMHEYLQNIDYGNFLSETAIRHVYSWNTAVIKFPFTEGKRRLIS